MELVFNKYQVCDDVRYIISRKVHKKNQEEINRHISVMIGWDEEYDYWNFFGEIVSTKYLIERENQRENTAWYHTLSLIEKERLSETPVSHKKWLEYKLDLISSYDRHYNTKKTTEKLPTEQYIKYIFSNKRIFSMNSLIRFRHIRDYVFDRVLHYSSYQFIQALPLAREHFLGTSDLTNGFTTFNRYLKTYNNKIFLQYMNKISNNEKKYHKQDEVHHLKDPLIHRINYPYSKKITKKDLIIYLTENGYQCTKNIKKKNKKQLWKIIMKLK